MKREKHEIQIKDKTGNWSAEAAGNTGNEFDSEAEALEAIEALKQLGDEWETAEYRVMPVREEPA